MNITHNKKNNTSTITLNPDDLIVFIDESGNEKLKDKNNPIFAVGGFCCYVKTFIEDINREWNNIKLKNFDTKGCFLHASEIDINNTKLIYDISSFFNKITFARFAYSYGCNTYNNTILNNAQIIANYIATTIIDFNLEIYKSNNICILVEKFSKRAYSYLKYLKDVFKIIQDAKKIEKKYIINIFNSNKKILVSGNEVADFIVQAAGGQAKRFNQGNTNLRKDYISVFNKIDKKYIKYFHSIGHKINNDEQT